MTPECSIHSREEQSHGEEKPICYGDGAEYAQGDVYAKLVLGGRP
jgi:hypothetical protein